VQHFRIHLPIVACVVFFAASGSAWAADCTKGLLWPYVRNPGDCLTDEEIRTGRIGVFTSTGAANQPNQAPLSGTTGGASTPQAGPPAPAAALTVSNPPAAVPALAASTAPAVSTASCSKGWFWPFVRDSGDCPTAVEKKNGIAPTQVSAPAPASTPNVSAAAQPAVAVAPSVNAASCGKSWLWPFVRDSGDCATTVEKKNSVAPTQVSAPAPASTPNVPAVQPASVSPAVAVAPSTDAASCGKGWLWPFVRDSGDCATTVEKKNGVATTQVSAPAPASTPNVPAAVQPASVSPAVAVAPSVNAASCGKGWLWPFVRESGDCPTAVEKKNGAVAATPISATQPAATPDSAAALPATLPESGSNDATCHKGLLWPFVRSDGDCPTDADKMPAHGQNRS